MLDLTGYGRLAELTKLTDRMTAEASKEAIVAAARLLALQVGQYQRKFGALPLEDAIELLESKSLDETQARWPTDWRTSPWRWPQSRMTSGRRRCNSPTAVAPRGTWKIPRHGGAA